MSVFIWLDGQQKGPFNEAILAKRILSGDLSDEILGWREGVEDWTPLALLLMREIDVAERASRYGAQAPPVPQVISSPKVIAVPSITREAFARGRRSSSRAPAALSANASRFHVILSLTFVALCAYLVSPYVSVWRLQNSLRSGDRDQIEAHVDFPNLRESIKDQVRIALAKNISTDENLKDNPFSGFATAFAPMVVNYMVDNFVTPSGLATMIADSRAAMRATVADKPSSTPRMKQEESFDWSKVRYAFFTSPTEFLVEVEDTKLILGFTGTGWKLRNIKIPNL